MKFFSKSKISSFEMYEPLKKLSLKFLISTLLFFNFSINFSLSFIEKNNESFEIPRN